MPRCINEKDDVDDQLPGRYVIRGASTKGSCSVSPTGREIQYVLLSPSEESHSKMMAYVVHIEEAMFTLPLEHDPTIGGLKEFFMIPKDIKDIIGGKWWLDIGILQVWCT